MTRALSFLFVVAPLFAADDRVKVDNDSVRILKVVDAPHKKSAMHRHELNRVMIYLDAGDIALTDPNGKTEQGHWKAGQVAWSAAGGLHTSENVGSSPVRIVEVELKNAGPATPATRPRDLDPLVIDPQHNTLLFENAQVRVFRSWREAGSAEKMHQHTGTGRAAVFLTDATLQESPAAPAVHRTAGDVSWSGPLTHATVNSGPSRMEMVVVEVK